MSADVRALWRPAWSTGEGDALQALRSGHQPEKHPALARTPRQQAHPNLVLASVRGATSCAARRTPRHGWLRDTPREESISIPTNERLARDVRELALSLGYRATLITKRATLNGRDCGRAYRVSFTTSDDVFRLERKRELLRQRSSRHNPERTRFRYIVDVRPVPSRPVRCITVDSPSHLFLAGEAMVPTHNTMSANVRPVAVPGGGRAGVRDRPRRALRDAHAAARRRAADRDRRR